MTNRAGGGPPRRSEIDMNTVCFRTQRTVKRRNGTAATAALAALYALALVPGVAVQAQEPAESVGPTQNINSKKVTLNLENADIRYALKLLFQSVGANYTLDQNVQGTVTA